MENDVVEFKKDLSSLLERDHNEDVDKLIKEKLDSLSKIEVTIAILEETGIGLIINQISKLKDRTLIAPVALNLKKSWMDIVKNKRVEQTSPEKKKDSEKSTISIKNTDNSKVNVKKRKDIGEVSSDVVIKTIKKPKFDTKSEHFQRHLRIKDKFLKYFKSDIDLIKDINANDDIIDSVSDDISYELIQSYGSDLPGLRKSLKVYYYAFGDKKNVELRRRMLTGDISAKALLEMPESSLANPEVQGERLRIEQEHFEKRLPVKKTATSNYHCKACGKNETSHFQVQTRSADEPDRKSVV